MFSYDLNQIPYNHTEEVKNIFKGLDQGAWRTMDYDIVQETGINTIPKKKKFIKANWLSDRPYKWLWKEKKPKAKEKRKDKPIWMQSSKE